MRHQPIRTWFAATDPELARTRRIAQLQALPVEAAPCGHNGTRFEGLDDDLMVAAAPSNWEGYTLSRV